MITLPMPASLIFENDEPYASGWFIRDEVMEWLLANVGSGYQCGGWSPGQSWQWNYRYEGMPVNSVICFDDPSAALMFKLTWGGHI